MALMGWVVPDGPQDSSAPAAGTIAEGPREPTRRRRPMKAAFGQPGFRLLFCGLLASMIGDSLMLIVLAIWVKDLTGSQRRGRPDLLLPRVARADRPAVRPDDRPGPAPYAADLGKRRLRARGDAAAARPRRGATSGSSTRSPCSTASRSSCLPAALNGLLKEMLPRTCLVDANASLSTTREALRLVGPLLGAGLTPPSAAERWRSRRVSFVVAAVAVACLHVREDVPDRTGATGARSSSPASTTSGATASSSTRVIALAIALLVVGFMESAVFAMVDAFGKPASYVGVIVSVQGVGAIAGGLVLGVDRADARRGRRRSCASLVLFATGAGRLRGIAAAAGRLRRGHRARASRCRCSSSRSRRLLQSRTPHG